MMRQRRVDRRSLLTALGAGAALAALTPGAGTAQTEGASYFIGVYMPHGMAREYWLPQADFAVTYPNCSLAPFADVQQLGKSYVDQLLVVEGLDVSVGIAGGTTGQRAYNKLAKDIQDGKWEARDESNVVPDSHQEEDIRASDLMLINAKCLNPVKH